MQLLNTWSLWRTNFLLFAVVLLAGCAAGQGAYNDGKKALLQQDYDQAVAAFMQAVELQPDKTEYKVRLQDARNKASRVHKLNADNYLAAGNYAQALSEYQLAADLNGSYFAAADGVKWARRHLQAETLTKEAAGLLENRRRQQALATVEEALLLVDDYQPALKLRREIERMRTTVIDGVELEVTSTEPITLNFDKTKLPDVFDILTKLSGINFILDEDIRGSNTTLFLERATFAQSLELLLRMNKLDKKILNSKTIILFPKTRDKQKQFEDQLIHTFYLSNIDAKKAVNLLRTMLQVRKIYVHEELNAIIIRDTPAVIKLAQKIIEANDRSDSEVVFDLELIEVVHTDGFKFGPKLSAYQLKIGAVGEPETTTTTNDGTTTTTTTSSIGSVVVDSFHDLSFVYGLPSATFDALKESGDGEVLANPKVRVKNKEKAKVHIGTREPIITVTINDTQTSENVQYVDVGVKLDVEPVIQLDNTVVTKLGLEVSNVSGRTTTENGTAVLTISTTNANTTLTLKDGQRTVIGGLIRDSNTKSKTSVPVLGDIPLLGALFTSYDKANSKSEIILSITPHIVKSVKLPNIDVSSIWSGGEDDLKAGRNFGTFAAEYTAGQSAVEPLYPPGQQLLPEGEQGQGGPPKTIAPGNGVETPADIPQPELLQPRDVEGSGAMLPSDIPAQPGANAAQPAVAALPAGEMPFIEEEIIDSEVPAAGRAAILFLDGEQSVGVGQEFVVSCQVEEIENLFSAPLYVQFDKNIFQFVSAAEGDFLKEGSSATVFTHTPLADSGRIIVGLKQGAGGVGSSGGGELFRMTFKAIAPGTAEIFPARTNFRNPQGERLKVDAVGLMVEAE